MPGWDKKTIYHSELRKESPLKLMFTIGVKTTKYADRNDYAPFRLPDDEMEYTYQIENEACADAIRQAPMNTWLLVTFEGVGEGEANLDIRAIDGGKPKAKAKAKPRGKYKGDAPASVEDGIKRCLLVANSLRLWFFDQLDRELDPVDKEIAATLYINWERSGFSLPLVNGEAEEPNGDDDPAAIVEAATLKEVGDLLKKVEVDDGILEKMEEMVEAGMTQRTAIRTLEYLRSLPLKEDQEVLPWETEEE